MLALQWSRKGLRIEILDKEDVMALAALAKRLLKGATTLSNELDTNMGVMNGWQRLICEQNVDLS